VDLSTPSEDRTRALRQEVNYMVAHSLHRHSESLVNAFERVALRVVQEIMKHQHSRTRPTLGSHKGEFPCTRGCGVTWFSGLCGLQSGR
jgi:hypothetical protein